MLPEYFEFMLPTKLIYGIGVIKNIGNSIKHLGPRKAILVTDKILEKAGPVGKVKEGFKNTNIDIVCTYSDVPPNSTIKIVAACAEEAKKNGCDMFIAVGGGSVIDTAKVANLLAAKGGSIDQYMGAYTLDRNDKLLPAIVIPTTAGTGSEVTKVAVIADPDNNVKLPFSEDQFLPTMAILDPELITSLPPMLTATTGMDALTHAIEAYVDKEKSPASDALALQAIKLISNNILLSCAYPDNLEARGSMLVGSFIAGVAFSHSMVGMVHGISHSLGGVYHIPHGLANALVLPEVMEYNLEAEPDRYAEIAMAMGVNFPQIVRVLRSMLKSESIDFVSKLVQKIDFGYLRDLSLKQIKLAKSSAEKAIGNLSFIDVWFREQAARAGIEKVRTLNRQLAHLTKMPLNLKDAGIKDGLKKLDLVVSTAMEDGSMLYNPVEPRPEDVKKIVQKLYDCTDEPLETSKEDLIAVDVEMGGRELKNVFKDSDALYDILLGFYELLKKDPHLGPSLKKTNLCIQFVYKNPSGTITIDAKGDDLVIHAGEFDGSPEVTMSMNADFAHKFWHGKANLITAITTRQVVAKGNVPKTLKLLPILKPAYILYPDYLRKKGLGHLVLT